MAEERPFKKGERVYLLCPTQPPGTTCPEGLIYDDDGRDEFVLLADGCYVHTERVRRDRRGKTEPVYEEVPRG